MTYFKTDVENASFSAAKNHAICTLGGVSEILAFQEGAKWGRERGFMEAVEMLGSAGMHAATDYLEWKRKEISK